MREPQYNILADVQDAIERAKQGKLALYWQRAIQREYHCKKVTPAEQQAYEQLQSILSEVPQWSDEEDLRLGMEEIGGKVWYCHYWEEHYSMVELTEDRNGKFNVDYVLDDAVTGCAHPGTDEVRFSCRSRFLSHASPKRPGEYYRVKSVPPGCVACIENAEQRGLGCFPNKHFATQKSPLYIRRHCLHRLCVLSGYKHQSHRPSRWLLFLLP